MSKKVATTLAWVLFAHVCVKVNMFMYEIWVASVPNNNHHDDCFIGDLFTNVLTFCWYWD